MNCGATGETCATCPLCERVLAARAGSYPLTIAELEESVVVLHEHQAYPGWCVLLLKDHAEHLADLDGARQQRVWSEVARVADAIRAAVKPARINYECLGNVIPHIHWHVIPRFIPPLDPDPTATVWVRPALELNRGTEPARAGELIASIRSHLTRT